MSSGICIFSEYYADTLEPVTLELITAAHRIKEVTGENIQAIVVAPDCKNLVEQLKAYNVDEIYAVNTKKDCLFQDDALSQIIAEMLQKINPSSVLVPASVIGRSIFSRVAAKLGNGLTADCTELKVLKRDDGSFYIKQNKPSFGENVFVSIVTKPESYPQMMTIRQGVYCPSEAGAKKEAAITYMDNISISESDIEVIELVPSAGDTDSILSAETVVVGGRGAVEEDTFGLVQQFADKLEAAIGGTRPLVDTGMIPFENQIGQTGCTIRPEICISLGVSGAIQHTEGLKDTKLFIAVNTDKDAPIFNVSDYGVVGDVKEVLDCFLKSS